MKGLSPAQCPAMIEIEAAGKRYGGTWVVKELNLRVERGELMVLLGGSGSGKTTTLKMINRLIEPTAGRILLDGCDTRERPAHELRRGIGYCFQEVGLFPHLSVVQNVGIVLELQGEETTSRLRRARELLEVVDLPPDVYAHRAPHQLSGGQRQRVGLARALAARPAVMLLDEPFGALDPPTRENLQKFFRNLIKDSELTCVFVTHDILEALLLGDRIAVLEQGRLVQVGSPAELLVRPATDYVASLMASPRRQLDAIGSMLRSSDGATALD